MSALLEPPIRQEFVYAAPPPAGVTVEQPLSRWQRVSQHALWRKAFILLSLALLWEGAARWTQNDLLLPSFLQTAQAFIGGIASGELLTRTAASLVVLLQGYAVGVLAAFVLTLLAVSSRIGRDLLETLTAMLNPLAGDRPAAAGPAVVRPGTRQPDLRHRPFRDVAAGPEHLCGLPGRARDPAHGRPQLRPERLAPGAAHPRAGALCRPSSRA